MDDNTPPDAGVFTEITVRIPDELARLVGASGKVERRMLEALALDEFRQGHLSRAELRRLLGFETRGRLDEFLASHEVFGTYTPEDLERDRGDLQRLGLWELRGQFTYLGVTGLREQFTYLGRVSFWWPPGW